MKAAFHEKYGPPDVVELREVEKPAIEDHQVLVRVHASSVNPAEWYGVNGPWFVRLFGSGIRRPKDPRWAPISRDGSKRSAATSRSFSRVTRSSARGRGVGRVRGGPGGSARAEAGQRVVRGSGGCAHRGAHGPPGAARPRPAAAGTEGADQRRIRRRRDVRRADRQGPRRRRDGRVLAAQRRAGARARCRPRRRLHAGGLHEARHASRRPDRHRGQQAVREAQAS